MQTILKDDHRNKLSFLKSKGICFGCLSLGHISKNCKKRLPCNVCKPDHLSALHIYTKNDQAKESERCSGVIGNASAEVCGHIGAGDQESVLSIVPVQVKAAKGSQVLQVYALLDPCSAATFCTETIMTQLSMKGKRTDILLSTMDQQSIVPAHVMSGIEVSALDSDDFLPLPTVFTQKEMPVTTNSIQKQSYIAQWEYLIKVKHPSINANVELLIGMNAPKLLEPWEVINSQNEGPYVMRTLLGWIINGPQRSGESVAATVNRISVACLEELLIAQYNQDFNEVASKEMEMSVKDKRFLEMASETVLQDGHYNLKLPFRRITVNMHVGVFSLGTCACSDRFFY